MSNDTYVTPGGILLTQSGLDKSRAERLMVAQKYLNEVGQNQTIEIAAMNSCMGSAIQHHGLPEVADATAFVEKVIAVANELTRRQLAQKYQGIIAACAHKNMKLPDVSPVMDYAAKCYGVDTGPASVELVSPAIASKH